ncbi:hypothetical protein [Sphingomonas agri]|uniref:hypothetical protein n=1 Tax=Sphingomonas agri TaxID=1813878 RepID=UPI00311E0D9F
MGQRVETSSLRALTAGEIRLVSGGGSSETYMNGSTEVTDYFDDAGNYTGSDYNFSDGSMDHYDRATETLDHFDAVNICVGASGGFVTGAVCGGTAADGGDWALSVGLVADPEARPAIDAIDGAHMNGWDVGPDSVTYQISGQTIDQTAGTVQQAATQTLGEALQAWITATSPDAACYIYGDPTTCGDYQERTFQQSSYQ